MVSLYVIFIHSSLIKAENKRKRTLFLSNAAIFVVYAPLREGMLSEADWEIFFLEGYHFDRRLKKKILRVLFL